MNIYFLPILVTFSASLAAAEPVKAMGNYLTFSFQVWFYKISVWRVYIPFP